MSEKVLSKMIFSLFYIIKQLFLQIMSKNQLIQVNRLKEIMNNVDLPLVLTHPPDKVRRLDLCRRWLICPFYVFFQVNICLSYTCIIFIFFFNLRLQVFHLQFCCFRIDRRSARNYRAFEKNNYFMNIMYKRILLNFGIILFINKEMVSFCSSVHL